MPTDTPTPDAVLTRRYLAALDALDREITRAAANPHVADVQRLRDELVLRWGSCFARDRRLTIVEKIERLPVALRLRNADLIGEIKQAVTGMVADVVRPLLLVGAAVGGLLVFFSFLGREES
jgi:hypothetical protein